MNILLALLGMWLISDSIFSLRTYWRKEDAFAQGIRTARLLIGIGLVVIAYL